MSGAEHIPATLALDLVRRAALAAGASPELAECLAAVSVEAEVAGHASVGLAHALDHLEALRAGRLDGAAEPLITRPLPQLFRVDHRGGLPQMAFARARGALGAAARDSGIVVYAARGGYTTGELGHYVRALADDGLVALATTNSFPLMAPPGVARAIYGTNPLAFSAPGPEGAAIVIDQSSSAMAFVGVLAAAACGEALPDHAAVDASGRPTTDPQAALAGHLLPFGGRRGGNLALVVELLSAGLTGAGWSLDNASAFAGDRVPDAGLFVLAVDAERLAPGASARIADYLVRIAGLGVHVPGSRLADRRAAAATDGLAVDGNLLRKLLSAAG